MSRHAQLQLTVFVEPQPERERENAWKTHSKTVEHSLEHSLTFHGAYALAAAILKLIFPGPTGLSRVVPAPLAAHGDEWEAHGLACPLSPY
jgi:hypothetical protein